MPKRSDIKSVLMIGAGPIVIGQACEFDYAGTQACKAIAAEGCRIILLNSNPATIMTDPEMADATYIEPVTAEVLEKIIEIEKPDALLPTIGGQTALNCALELAKKGVLQKHNVKLIGASVRAIELAEDRQQFRQAMQEIGLDVPRAITIKSIDEAKAMLADWPLPLVVRPSFALGGSGAGIAYTAEEFMSLCISAFNLTPQQEITIDEALLGWKEYELEIVRDKQDNCIVVCGIENIDPLGIHTGDSIAVAPIQTLTDKEYQRMRQAAFAVLRKVGVETGGSNVQFAVHPQTGRMVVIEMNPRVSRSSALVSKASGFPIAKIAAKLALGYTLDELKNDITGDQLPASFEPSLDYVVVKIPKFDLQKFPDCDFNRGPQMRSVGEVMAIGRTFIEALQKALRSLESKDIGFGHHFASWSDQDLKMFMKKAPVMQLWAIAEALHRDMTVETLQELTQIDPWFLIQLEQLIKLEKHISKLELSQINEAMLYELKQFGFADEHLAQLLKIDEKEIYDLRQQWNIKPVYKRIDSCAGEFVAETAYLYSTYEQENESEISNKSKVMIIGSGPNRIGQGIEFDYCCVQAAKAIRLLGHETIMLNCNPETVSTDYDMVDKLYCTPLSFEDIYEIIQMENPIGVLIQYGGQTPLKLAEKLSEAGVSLLGLTQDIIHQTEDRKAFQSFLNELQLLQPRNKSVYSVAEGLQAAEEISFPVIVRPSFVLGGAAMLVVNNAQDLANHLAKIFAQDNKHPVLIETYLQHAIEVDVDAIADGTHVFVCGLLEHIEPAGIHSGDSACFTPPINLNVAIQEKIQEQTKKIGHRLKLKGVFNVQFAVKGEELYVIEVNPRASRTLPFLCKATGRPLVQVATNCLFDMPLSSQLALDLPRLNYFYVKEAVMPFNKFLQANPMLGPEMKSTGEVMGIGQTAQEAYAKAQFAAGNAIPTSGQVWLITNNQVQEKTLHIQQLLEKLGFSISINEEKPAQPTIIISLIENTETNTYYKTLAQQAVRTAIEKKVCYVTTFESSLALIDAIEFHQRGFYNIMPIQRIHQQQFKHLLTGEELSTADVEKILQQAKVLKDRRHLPQLCLPLAGKQLAMLFAKQSLRTRMSFTVAMRELGGDVIESLSNTRKFEEPQDLIRVLNGYCHAIMVRTHDDDDLEVMAKKSIVPIINGLSDLHHPCQIFADFLTIQETFGQLNNLKLAYIGDGNNILHSLLLLAPRMGLTIHYCCPEGRGPNEKILQKSLSYLTKNTGQIVSFDEPSAAIKNVNAVYTDVWTSMGFEGQSAEHLFAGFQVNEDLMQHAQTDAIFMHCLPMERGKEVSETLPDHPCSVIFQQSENRLHLQKALLLHLLNA